MPTWFTPTCPVPSAVLVIFGSNCFWKEEKKWESINETAKVLAGRKKKRTGKKQQKLVPRKPRK